MFSRDKCNLLESRIDKRTTFRRYSSQNLCDHWIGLKWNLDINSGTDRRQFGQFICHFHIVTA